MRKLCKSLFILLTSFLISNFTFGQENNFKPWSATQKLNIDDFKIKTSQLETLSSYAQFSIDFSIKGYDFLTKNFNKKIRNNLITSASWIDTTSNFKQTLGYQQALFDMSEIYARQFRKALSGNRKQIAKGIVFVEALSHQFMNEFAKRRIAFDIETKLGVDGIKQKLWETQIQKELDELSEFAYEYK